MTRLLPVRTVVASTPRTRLFTIDLEQHPFPFRAGQAVFAGLADGAVRRPYSIACSPAQAARQDAIELLVQIDDEASPDPHLERAQIGTRLHIEGPFGSFALPTPFTDQKLLLIAGGTGIAPLRAMMWDTLERTPACPVSMIYSARAPEEFAFLDELGALSLEGRIALSLTVTRAANDTWTGARGRIDHRLVAASLGDVQARAVVCGPAAFVADVRELLAAAGVSPDRILKETYTA